MFGPVWWWVWVVGAVLSLVGELVHELIENSECVINLYRNNSGTSSQYEGDSTQNISNIDNRVTVIISFLTLHI